MKNCAICSNKFPSWIKIDGKYRNLKNRKYCFECSPFGKHNTIKLEGYSQEDNLNNRKKCFNGGDCLKCENKLKGNQTKYCSNKCKFDYRKEKLGNYPNSCKIENLEEVQALYDSGLSWRKVASKIGLSASSIFGYAGAGYLKSRTISESTKISRKNKPQRHSEKSKSKISEARKKWLKENPDKHNWSFKTKHNSSVPCENFKRFLKEKNIEFIEEYKPLLHKNRFFSIDVAFPDNKIGIEINGNQHYDTDGKLKPYYQNRHDLIVAEGWTLYEIPYKAFFSEENMKSVLEQVENEINQ